MKRAINILRGIAKMLFPDALFREWPLMLTLCIMLAPFPCYFLVRAVMIPDLWLLSLSNVLYVLFFAYLCARTTVMFRNEWMRAAFKTAFYLAGGTLFMIQFVSLKFFNFGICPDLLVMMMQTNVHEAQGFMETFILPRIVWLILPAAVIVAVIVMLELFGGRISAAIARTTGRRIQTSVKMILAVGVIAGAVLTAPLTRIFAMDFGELRIWKGKFEYRTKNDFFDNTLLSTVYSLTFVCKGNDAFRDWENLQRDILTAQEEPQTRTDSLEIVFVMGESYIRSHSELYGYRHHTTPRQMQEKEKGNLTVWSYISSVAKSTDITISNVFNLNNYTEGEAWQSSAFFPAIFKKAGWPVYMYNNNTTGNNIANFVAHGIFSSDFIRTECFGTAVGSEEARYDCEMVSDAQAADHGGDSPRRLVLFHLQGQHVAFARCVPPGREKFTASDYGYRAEPWMTDTKRQMIADYDNATLANDSVMGMIYDHWRDRCAVVVYVSDHGEEVYDYRDSMGRINRNGNSLEDYIESYFMVPVTVWMSDRFMALYPEKAEAIREACTRSGSTDDTGHFLLGLAGIDTPYYRPERDIASAAYRPLRRLTTEGFHIDGE